MPTYDFQCPKCNTQVEMHFGYDSTHAPICVECGGTMNKNYTPPAVIFRGGGWGGQ
jgi:putative FmdB family regulatory protein